MHDITLFLLLIASGIALSNLLMNGPEVFDKIKNFIKEMPY